MTVKLIKQMIDACRLGKRACDMMPPLPKDVLPSYIHVLDTIHTLEAAGGPVRAGPATARRDPYRQRDGG